jgi:ascorbate PTS system EIIA or EIIAB component
MEPVILLPDTAIIIGAPAADWRDAIRWAGRALVDSGVATDAYTDEMIATVESLGPYIVIAPGIALAHSRPSPSVLRAGLCLVTLANPVEFGNADNDPVTLVVGLAAPDANGHVESLATLADFLADDGRREALIAARDVATVRKLINQFELSLAAEGTTG